MASSVATPRNYLPFFDSWDDGFGRHFPCFAPVTVRHIKDQDLHHHVPAGATCKKDDRSNSCSSADEAKCNARIAAAHQAHDQQLLREAIMDLLERKMCDVHRGVYADPLNFAKLHNWAWQLAWMLLLSKYDPDGNDVPKFEEQAFVGRGRKSRVMEAKPDAEATQWLLASAMTPPIASKQTRKRKRDDHDRGDELQRPTRDRATKIQRTQYEHETLSGFANDNAVTWSGQLNSATSSNNVVSSENVNFDQLIVCSKCGITQDTFPYDLKLCPEALFIPLSEYCLTGNCWRRLESWGHALTCPLRWKLGLLELQTSTHDSSGCVSI